MSEIKNPGEKTLSVTPTKHTLTLKRGVEQGVVRQSFSHGRTKAVVVEKVKRRALGPAEGKAEPAVDARAGVRRTASKPAAAPAATAAPAAPAPSLKPSGVVLRALSDEELNRRAHALDDARVREAEERRVAEEEARRRADRESRERTERDAAEARKREEEDRRRHEEETKRKAEQEAKKRFGEEEAKAKPGSTQALRAQAAAEAEDEEPRRAVRRPGAARAPAAPKPARPGAEKRRGRLTLVTALSQDEVRERSVASFRRRVQRLKGHQADEPKEKLIREVTIPESITI
ncbi:MAG: translation initiation factor IF-2 associated domain-containing protein, partial [Hyphomicrobiales bacterium]|nr:translation initiation factor IF-2 associated domain-containing protein [Hyphomicrobiales bacterium]